MSLRVVRQGCCVWLFHSKRSMRRVILHAVDSIPHPAGFRGLRPERARLHWLRTLLHQAHGPRLGGGQVRLDHVHAMKEVPPKDKRLDVKRAAAVGRSYGEYMTLVHAGMHPDLCAASCETKQSLDNNDEDCFVGKNTLLAMT